MNYVPPSDARISGAALAVIIGLSVVFLGFFLWCYVRIIRRAGYSGWWMLMALVPIGNLIMLGLFPFTAWPIQRELDYLRRHASMTGLPGYGTATQQGYGPQQTLPPAPRPQERRLDEPDDPAGPRQS